MSELTRGTLVLHSSLGMGRVVAVEPDAIHVFFPESAKRFAAKLRWPLAKPMLRTEGLEPDPWLQGLTSFALDEASGRYALTGNWLTHDQAVADFLERTPGGFAAASRTARWRTAREGWVELLGGGKGEALQAAGDTSEIVSRLRKVERLVAAVAGVVEGGALETALADAALAGPWLEALFELLSVPSPSRARFEKLFAATAALPAPAGTAWTIATLFPFLADPEKHVLLRPKATRGAAERLGCDIRYDAAPNWGTYATLRSFCGKLLERLQVLGAHDQADVETFLHGLSVRRAAGRAEADGAAAPRAPRAPRAKAVRASPGRPRAKARAEG